MSSLAKILILLLKPPDTRDFLLKIATDKLHLSSSDDRIISILPLVLVYPVLYVDIVDIVDIVCR